VLASISAYSIYLRLDLCYRLLVASIFTITISRNDLSNNSPQSLLSLSAWSSGRSGPSNNFDYAPGDTLIGTRVISILNICCSEKSTDSLFIHRAHLLNNFIHLDWWSCRERLKHFLEDLCLVFRLYWALKHVHYHFEVKELKFIVIFIWVSGIGLCFIIIFVIVAFSRTLIIWLGYKTECIIIHCRVLGFFLSVLHIGTCLGHGWFLCFRGGLIVTVIIRKLVIIVVTILVWVINSCLFFSLCLNAFSHLVV